MVLILGACVVLFVVWGIVYFVKWSRNDRRMTAMAKGTVIRTDESGTSFTVTIDGVVRTGRTKMLANKPRPANSHCVVNAGDSVSVVYDPKQPECFRMAIDQSEKMLGWFCEIIAGILLIVILIICL